MQNLHLPVLKMSCAACSKTIERILKKQTGVLDVQVNYANESVKIYLDETLTSLEFLQSKLQEFGYDLLLPNIQEKLTLEEIQQKNYIELKNKTFLAILFSIPLFLISMFFMHTSYLKNTHWILFSLTTPILFFCGNSFFINAYKQAKNGVASMDTLIALSTSTAYLFSTFNSFYPQFWWKQHLDAPVYFEASALIITFVLIGKWLETKAKANTSEALKKLMSLQVKNLTIIENNQPKSIPITDLQKEQLVEVKAGEKIAVDGILTEGHSWVNESLMTGEATEVEKKVGDFVFAGTINQNGTFRFIAKKIGKETLLAQIIQSVQEAQGSKAPIERLANKIAQFFVPALIIIAILSACIWIIFGTQNAFNYGILAFINVLVIACPCALGLATPTALMVGIGKAAKHGILIKNAESLEVSKKIDTLVLDKTGTLTEGTPQLHYFYCPNAHQLAIFTEMEKKSDHPLAKTLVQHFGTTKNTSITLSHFNNHSGLGISAQHETENYLAGNASFIYQHKIIIPEKIKNMAENWQNNACTLVYFANSKQVLGVFALSDSLKPTSKKAIQLLKNQNIEIHMLTGDHEQSASQIANSVGIKYYQSSVLPLEKAQYIKTLQQQNKIVAMVGDGINDSTALAQANVSIAMGKGSDIAINIADITLLHSDLLKIPLALTISKQTTQTIRYNLFWAFIYNVIGIPIAAGILYPFTGYLLNPMFASIAMVLSSISVLGNSLFLKIKK